MTAPRARACRLTLATSRRRSPASASALSTRWPQPSNLHSPSCRLLRVHASASATAVAASHSPSTMLTSCESAVCRLLRPPVAQHGSSFAAVDPANSRNRRGTGVPTCGRCHTSMTCRTAATCVWRHQRASRSILRREAARSRALSIRRVLSGTRTQASAPASSSDRRTHRRRLRRARRRRLGRHRRRRRLRRHRRRRRRRRSLHRHLLRPHHRHHRHAHRCPRRRRLRIWDCSPANR